MSQTNAKNSRVSPGSTRSTVAHRSPPNDPVDSENRTGLDLEFKNHSKSKNQINQSSDRIESLLAGALVALVAAITYGILIPRLGFYRDDWYMLWAGQSDAGISAIIRLFQTDRPLIGWVYALIFKSIGANVFYWQFYALLLKILTGLTFLWIMRLVWPEKRLETTLAALLFVLYPGFYQQPVAATFIIDLVGLNAAFISIALTIYAVKPPSDAPPLLQVLATLVAMALCLFYVALYEATIGLEAVRWVLVWYLIQARAEPGAYPQEKRSDFKASAVTEDPSQDLFRPILKTTVRAIKILFPYLLVIAGFVFWRLFFFKSVRRATNINFLLADYASNPLYSISQILIGYLKDLFETIVSAWVVPFYQFTADGRYTDFLAGLGVSIVVLALVAGYIIFYRRQNPGTSLPVVIDNGFQSKASQQDPFSRHFLIIGLIAVAIPSAIIVVLGRNVLFSTQWDRYTTQSMLGVAMVVGGAILYFLRGSARRVVFFSLLFLAVMTQYHSAAYYARFWDYERNVIWQLSWRAPALQEDTTVILSLPEGYRLAEEYEIWAPVNMAYYPGQPMQVSGQIPTDGLLLDLVAKTLDKRTVRNINVRRDYGKALLLSMPSQNSCLHVLDGQRLALPFFENGRIKEVAEYSNIQLIDVAAKPITPSASTFGLEPDHGWCYYYQKIELTLQAGNFAEAARLADEAAQKGLKAADETEWISVVVAYASTSQDEKAAVAAQKIDKDLRKYICLQQTHESGAKSPDSLPDLLHRPDITGSIPLGCNAK